MISGSFLTVIRITFYVSDERGTFKICRKKEERGRTQGTRHIHGAYRLYLINVVIYRYDDDTFRHKSSNRSLVSRIEYIECF